MKRTILVSAAMMGFLAVALGAFGAHGLEKLVDQDAISTFETGVRYQMYHALFLFVLGMVPDLSLKAQRIIYRLVIVGVVFFSFSIYLLALNSVTAFDFKVIGIITPIGGTLLLIAWAYMGYQLYKSKLK
ncbi:DUF423 domain-containing protein [Maribacter sp. PR1]|uniref:DUF423 domain-containing protein n=1 Tax=Maribacter cobaltidurans TaxID=1178778 RepID=A0ABU7IRI6_9FLAO|nr:MULTISPECIES: DUF423 domain-containing protein [Maribacter]MDC6388199.1 DUF423 domain-containing protein [Maribacter sp. PR1]MEE1975587.1 DUF423 domain-containing protein [Maribacter cobaltidurans]